MLRDRIGPTPGRMLAQHMLRFSQLPAQPCILRVQIGLPGAELLQLLAQFHGVCILRQRRLEPLQILRQEGNPRVLGDRHGALAQQLGLEPFDLGRLLGDDPGAALLHPAQLAGQDPMLAGQTNDMGNVGPQRRPGLLLQPVHGAQTRSSVHRARLAAMAEALR